MENLETKSIAELKALVYDKIAQQESITKTIGFDIRKINEVLSKKLVEEQKQGAQV